jgi:hypothetical protein
MIFSRSARRISSDATAGHADRGSRSGPLTPSARAAAALPDASIDSILERPAFVEQLLLCLLEHRQPVAVPPRHGQNSCSFTSPA